MAPVPYVEVWASLAIGLWFVVVAYELLLFGYFALLKGLRLWAGGQRQKGNTIFYIFFGLFFLLLALGRGFFVVWDFYVQADLAYQWIWRIGEVLQWIALTFMFLAITIRIFENRILKFGIPLVPAVCAIIFLILPEGVIAAGLNDPVYFALNVVIAPAFAIVIPLIYLYVAVQSVGVIRNSSLLVGGGFLVYYLGRVLHTLFVAASNPAVLILAPGIVIIGILIMTAGAILTK
ncbi:MAG: hypothetical protein WED04_05615 [Promethearchaeati archaeon SRVP18_Atabeyarchaeia-1]